VGEHQAPRDHRIFAPVLAPPAVGRVEELHQGPNELVYLVESDRPAFLRVQIDWDRYGPDWHAEGLATVGAPSGHLAVSVPAGETRVVLRYRTPGLAAGALLSALTAIALVAVLLRSRGRWTSSRAE
jgi:hypothetical protein